MPDIEAWHILTPQHIYITEKSKKKGADLKVLFRGDKK